MKIGELFIALGFKVQGQDALEDAERGIQRAAVKAGALAVAVNGINYAFLRMIDGARAAAVEMKNFAGATGLSTEELKRWQAAGAINDVAEKEVAQTITAVQRGIANIRLGQGNIKPFQMLGVQPEDNTFAAIDKMAASLRQLRPEIAAVIAAEAGISDPMFQWMRRADFTARQLEQRYIMSQQEQGALVELNRQWQALTFNIKSVRDKFASSFTPVLIVITKTLKLILDQLAKFVEWLNKATTASHAARVALQGMVLVLALVGVTLAGIAAALGLAAGAMAVLSLAAMPVVVAFTVLGLALVGAAAAITWIILLIDDLNTAIKGGQSYYDWNEGFILTLKNVERVAAAIEKLIELKEKLAGLGGGTVGFGASLIANPLGFAISAAESRSRGTTITQTNNVKVLVDGAQNPQETGRAVATEVEQAAYQMPVPNY